MNEVLSVYLRRVGGDGQFVAGGIPPDVTPVFTYRFNVLENDDPILLSLKQKILSVCQRDKELCQKIL